MTYRGSTNATHIDSKRILTCYLQEIKATDYDFTVIVEDRRFPCHRFVLSACSGFFKGLLRSDMAETRKGEATLKEIKSEIFASILVVLYEGSDVLTEENMLMMWQAANQLQIMFLIEACEDFITEHPSRNNVFDIYNIALLMHSEKVLMAVRKALVDNITFVSKTEMFLSLPYHELLKVVQMAGDRHIASCGKSKCDWFYGVMSSIVHWVFGKLDKEQRIFLLEINTEERMHYLNPLLSAAKINSVSRQCLIQLMKNDDVMSCKIPREVVIRALEQILSAENARAQGQYPYSFFWYK